MRGQRRCLHQVQQVESRAGQGGRRQGAPGAGLQPGHAERETPEARQEESRMIILRCKLCGRVIKVWFDFSAVIVMRKLIHVINDRMLCEHCAHYWARTGV